ncbi:MAG TPA: hypothetical protein VFT55_16615, partial [Planctomycetota bacterium]|nr:hypothetical protein [Planctomycetota bacterium]
MCHGSLLSRSLGSGVVFGAVLVAQELRQLDTPLFQNAIFDPVRQRIVATSIGGYSHDWDGTAWRQEADAGAPAGFTWFDVATQRRMTLARRFVGTGMQLFLWARTGSGWQQQAMPSQPPLRNDIGLAYDSARGEVLAFGGYAVSPPGPLGDTWTWNGASWTQHAVAGPSPRTEVTIGYDATRQRVVLFGGRMQAYTSGNLADTWEWNGSAWNAVPTPSAPPPHARSRLVHDMARQRMVMIGLADGGSFPNETWEYDGTTWTQCPSPPGFVGTEGAVAYDPVRAETLVFGGYGTNDKLGGVAAWNGTTWSQHPGFTDLPAQSYGTEVTPALNGTDVCMFSPWVASGASNRLMTFDGSSWSLTASGGPPPRGDPLVWTLAGAIYVHAGANLTAQNDLWAWNGATWTQLFPPVSPPPRARATWTVDP